MTRPEHIVVLVFELHDGTAEFRQVPFDVISQLVAGKDGLLLEDPDMADGLDDLPVDPPQGGIAEQEGIVVEETGLTGHFPVGLSRTVDILVEVLGTQQTDQRVLLLRLVLGWKTHEAGERQQDGQENPFPHDHSAAWLTAFFHPSREKSQSAKIGSM